MDADWHRLCGQRLPRPCASTMTYLCLHRQLVKPRLNRLGLDDKETYIRPGEPPTSISSVLYSPLQYLTYSNDLVSRTIMFSVRILAAALFAAVVAATPMTVESRAADCATIFSGILAANATG